MFTHLSPADRDNYLREIRRVLRPGGRCFATFFLLDVEAEQAMAQGRASSGWSRSCTRRAASRADAVSGRDIVVATVTDA